VIGQLVQGDRALHLVLGVLIVKWLIWSVALGSGTSGGVLAPVMMIGAAIGALLSYGMPAHMGASFWVMIGIGATLSAALRVPMTAIVFTVEETHDWNMLLPLLIGCVVSYAVSSLLLRRSILTEKVARRGYHVSAEYVVDPLELLYVREVMRTKTTVLHQNENATQVADSLARDRHETQSLFPVLDAAGTLRGLVTRNALLQLRDGAANEDGIPLANVARAPKAEIYPDEPLRAAVYQMAEQGVTRMPVVERGTRRWLGMISLEDLLKARTRHLEEERRRERVLRWNGFGRSSIKADRPARA
jgi:chloride channel protein, CIC family